MTSKSLANMGIKSKKERPTTSNVQTTLSASSSSLLNEEAVNVEKVKSKKRKFKQQPQNTPFEVTESRKEDPEPKSKKLKSEQAVSKEILSNDGDSTVREPESTEAAAAPDGEAVEVPKKIRKPRTRIRGEGPKVRKPPQPPRLKQKKKKKKKKEKTEPKSKDVEYIKKKGIKYLKQWKNEREEWKFHKLRQIWLIDHMFDDSMISEELFPVFLEYATGAKGQFVKVILQKANDAIKTMEDNQQIDLKDIKYLRSRQIMQSLGEDVE